MIQRRSLFCASLALATPLAFAQSSTWVPDKAHSEVDFSILHLSLSNVRGHFGNLGGTIILDESDITKSIVDISIDVSTVDTGVAPRDADLKSADFFDVAHFPTATFVSTRIRKSGSGLVVSGNLTLHGMTKPVILQVMGPTGPVSGMDKKPHAGFSAVATVSRTDFGIATKYPSSVVGDDVKLTIDLDVAKR